MWTPDVYEGAPTPVTTFFATAPKMAAVAILVRLLVDAFPGVTRDWQQVVTFMAIASMALGAFAAITQTNIKRLMAYSSIGNMGYALVGLASGTVQGVEGVAIFMAIYLAMTLGAFACILSMKTDNRPRREDRRSLGPVAHHPYMAAMLHADPVLADRHSAARRVLRQVLCLRCSDQGQAAGAGDHRHPHQRGLGLLLPARRQGDVSR
jgi:NADH-quinone oxidoreductase subunit N